MHKINLKVEADEAILSKYEEAVKSKSTDSGFDIFMPYNLILSPGQTLLVNMKVRFEPLFRGGYYLYPRSSLGKTPLRMANSVGIIDNGYRGFIKVWIQNTSEHIYKLKKGERYVQVCHPSLMPMKVTLVEEIDMETERGEGGFGSTGN
jgi:dUTP pyrophosphatase